MASTVYKARKKPVDYTDTPNGVDYTLVYDEGINVVPGSITITPNEWTGLTGTVEALGPGVGDADDDLKRLDGYETLFAQEINVGQRIRINGEIHTVASITDNVTLHVEDDFSSSLYDDTPEIEIIHNDLAIQGNGTNFMTALKVDDWLEVNGEIRKVTQLVDDEAVIVNAIYNNFGTEKSIRRYRDREQYEPLSGNAVVLTSGTKLYGEGTRYTVELIVGDYVYINNELREVVSIESNTELTVATPFTVAEIDISPQKIKRLIDRTYIALTGQVFASGFTVTGTGTAFLAELAVGDYVYINRETKRVNEIVSDTELKVGNDFFNTGTDPLPKKVNRPSEYVLSGQITKTAGSTTVTGIFTHFADELSKGNIIVINGELRKVDTVISDTEFTVETPFTISSSVYGDLAQKIYFGLLDFRDIEFNNEKDYSEVVKITFSLTEGTESEGELKLYDDGTNTNDKIEIVDEGNGVWSLSSQYNKDGITQNIWNDLTNVLERLYFRVANSDTSIDFTINCEISDEYTTDSTHNLYIKGYNVVDARHIVQNYVQKQDERVGGLGSPLPQIDDFDEVGRRYRVTLTTSDTAKGVLYGQTGAAQPSLTLTDELYIEGTQGQINTYLENIFVVQGPDNTEPYSIEWKQEVIEGETGVPYVQEMGLFSYTMGDLDLDSIVPSEIFYIEDGNEVPLGITFNDTRGEKFIIDVINDDKVLTLDDIDYTVTLTLTDPSAGSFTGAGIVDAGGGVYTYTSTDVTTWLGSTVSYLPAADYTGNTSYTITVTRDNAQGDPLWYSTNWNTQGTLINNASCNITNNGVHDEFALNTTQTYQEDTIQYWTIGSITDEATSKQYVLTLTASDPNAIDSITNFTNQGGGAFTIGPFDKATLNTVLNIIQVTPAADYTGAYNITYQQQQTTDNINQGSATINVSASASHGEFIINGSGFTYDEDLTTNWNFSSITDLASNKNYTVTLTVSNAQAVDSIASFTNQGAGVFTLSGTKATINSVLSGLNLQPAADYTGAYTITYQQQQTTDNINQGTSLPIPITANATHNEFAVGTIASGSEGETILINMGQITDLASNKNYTITLTLSNPAIGTIGSPWVSQGGGVYTLSGTKASINPHLLSVPLNTSDGDFIGALNVTYQQQQTTDSINQGSQAVTVNVSNVVDAINITSSHSITQEDEYIWTFTTPPQIADQAGAGSGKTYRVTMAPQSPADDVYTMWTDSIYAVGSTYSSTLVFEGTQTQINDAIQNHWHLDKTTPDNSDTFNITWTQEVIAGVTGVPYTQETGVLTFNVTADVNGGYQYKSGYFSWTQGVVSPFTGLANITDTRGDQFDTATVLYRAEISLDAPVTADDGVLSSTIGTWDEVTSTLTIEGTKAQVNNDLQNNVTWLSNPIFSDNFTINVDMYRNINSAGWVLVSENNIISVDSATGLANITGRYYDEDIATDFSDNTKTITSSYATFTRNVAANVTGPIAGPLDIGFISDTDIASTNEKVYTVRMKFTGIPLSNLWGFGNFNIAEQTAYITGTEDYINGVLSSVTFSQGGGGVTTVNIYLDDTWLYMNNVDTNSFTISP